MASSLRWIRARFVSANQVLLLAGAISIVVATVATAIGRSPVLCGEFVVVGSALMGVSAFAPETLEHAMPTAVASFVGMTPATDDVVVDDDRASAVEIAEAPARRISRRLRRREHGHAPRGHTKIAGATRLALLLVCATVSVLAATLAILIVVLLVLTGH